MKRKLGNGPGSERTEVEARLAHQVVGEVLLVVWISSHEEGGDDSAHKDCGTAQAGDAARTVGLLASDCRTCKR